MEKKIKVSGKAKTSHSNSNLMENGSYGKGRTTNDFKLNV